MSDNSHVRAQAWPFLHAVTDAVRALILEGSGVLAHIPENRRRQARPGVGTNDT